MGSVREGSVPVGAVLCDTNATILSAGRNRWFGKWLLDSDQLTRIRGLTLDAALTELWARLAP